MSDLGFALDGLYACGWWPSDGDRCLQNADGRWYPDETMILQFFAQSLIHPQICQSPASGAVEVLWSSFYGGRQSVHGRFRMEALILAYTDLYRQTHARVHSY